MLFRAVTASARGLTCSLQAGLSLGGWGAEPRGRPWKASVISLVLRAQALSCFFYYKKNCFKSFWLRYFKHSENNIMDICALPIKILQMWTILSYLLWISLSFFFFKGSHLQIWHPFFPPTLCPRNHYVLLLLLCRCVFINTVSIFIWKIQHYTCILLQVAFWLNIMFLIFIHYDGSGSMLGPYHLL